VWRGRRVSYGVLSVAKPPIAAALTVAVRIGASAGGVVFGVGLEEGVGLESWHGREGRCLRGRGWRGGFKIGGDGQAGEVLYHFLVGVGGGEAEQAGDLPVGYGMGGGDVKGYFSSSRATSM